MKQRSFFGLMTLGLIFTACQSNVFLENPDETTDGERIFYVNMNIRGDVDGKGTRAAEDYGNPVAEDFSDGESDVNEAYFVFYDKDGTAIGSPINVPLKDVAWTPGEDGTIDKYYKSVVGVTVSNGQENPSQVICYLNPQNTDNLTKPLSEIQEATREALYTTSTSDNNTKKYFSMSNSVFYKNTSSEAPQIAVQISPNQLFNTRAAAEAAQNDASLVVNIYVERYAAKLTFKTTDPGVYTTYSRGITSNSETGTEVKLTFVPSTWMLNASCDNTFVVKSFRKENSDGSNYLKDNYAYQELNDVINRTINGVKGDWTWNATDFNRSYWGMSPAYFTSVYPEVSSDVASLNETSDALNQHYYSYNELIEGIGGKEPVGYTLPTDVNGVTEYVHETTVGSKALASKNVVAAFPSVILVGDYTVNIGGQTYTGIDFYTYSVVSTEDERPLVYFDVKEGSLNGASAIDGGESILLGLIKAATNLYKKDGDNFVNFNLASDADIEKLVAVLEVAEPSGEVKGSLKVPERYRTLQFKSNATPAQLEGIYIATTEGYSSIAADGVSTPAANQVTQNFANQELMQVVGYCAKYNAGAAYFNIPVKHFGWYRTSNSNKDQAKINWSKVRVGDFGVVRNHSYTVDVTAITGLGTGIGGKDNPIVPPAEENRYYVAYSVNILKWAVVPTQTVRL